ncbi:hypothetical protein BOTBODRAFT_106418 [Botryobasidium botryosum FD-172 SS1]|uniref:DUF7598 domain-containing protein n=1 Tax=Botryobasidium botryosum (strain FD-172 SS1) TaxID=930990 RepID=A0A067MQI6_BOTB1|nr:hypothetical protein BOTBODRAFT_106418 [Botryobasidium botryosum FD-172 SS1]
MIASRGFVFIGLNIVRVLSIITLILVFSSTIFVMVNDANAVHNEANLPPPPANATHDDLEYDCDYIEGSTVPNQPAGVFFAMLSHLFILFQCILLTLAEVGWPESFFVTYLPVLGPDFGVGILGAIECLIGAAVLSHNVGMFALVSAFFLFAMGCLNMAVGLVFRGTSKSRRSISSWRESNEGELPRGVSGHFSIVSSAKGGSVGSKMSGGGGSMHEFGAGGGYGFGRQGEKHAGLRGFMISQPKESLPRYASNRTVSTHSTRSATPPPQPRAPSPPPSRI